MNKHKFLRTIQYPMLALGLCFCSPHALALEVIEGIGSRTTTVERLNAAQEIEEIEAIREAEYRHEVGFDFDKTHISDLKAYWNAGALFY